ncbi:MAG: membrane protein insertase YidC [Syntrophomonadaceae bacterium]|nr:membrane protein insertase YidC [Syntrophomonadaceae bacterium]
MWQSFVNGFSQLIQFVYGLTVDFGVGSYGLAIILITILLKILIYPLSAKQMESMRAMQEIQPKVKELQEKFKKQPERAQQAVMELYQKHKVNPLAGCLPLLIQMPILIAFYQALLHIEYLEPAHAGFFWIPNLSEPDRMLILPILAAASTFWQQIVTTPAAMDQTQKYLLFFMPLFIGYISYKFPAGLALYWVVFSVLGALQQIYVNRKGRKGGAEVEVEIVTEKPVTKPSAKAKKGVKRKHAR